MVVDILMRVDAVEFQSFVDRWGVTVENEHTFSREQRKKMEQENPLIFHFNTALNVNGVQMPSKRGCSTVYAPSMSETHREEQLQLMDYYNLDRRDCWVMQRSTYPWAENQIEDITTLEITISHQPMYLSGPVFEVKVSGETVEFTNRLQVLPTNYLFRSLKHRSSILTLQTPRFPTLWNWNTRSIFM